MLGVNIVIIHPGCQKSKLRHRYFTRETETQVLITKHRYFKQEQHVLKPIKMNVKKHGVSNTVTMKQYQKPMRLQNAAKQVLTASWSVFKPRDHAFYLNGRRRIELRNWKDLSQNVTAPFQLVPRGTEHKKHNPGSDTTDSTSFSYRHSG